MNIFNLRKYFIVCMIISWSVFYHITICRTDVADFSKLLTFNFLGKIR